MQREREAINEGKTAIEIWADSAYRSKTNENQLADQLLTSRMHRSGARRGETDIR